MDRENVIPPKTDAEFVAEAAAVALTEGRYELGRALADLASRAARIEAAAVPRMVPMIGATREEHPGQTTDMYAAGPTGNGDQDLAAAAQTEIFGQQDQRMAVAKSARCATEIGQGAYREPCHRPLYWRTGNIGDQDHPATIAGWYHVDPALDQDHMPTVDQGAH